MVVWEFAQTTIKMETQMLKIDHSRDQLLTDFGKATLKDRYLMTGEQPQDLFARVATTYGNDEAHSQRLYDYMSKLWFMPATPVLSNGGTERGQAISCFLSEATDDMQGIVSNWVENIWLACRGGGIGAYWGNVRSINEGIGGVGKSSGVIPFIKVQDSLTLAISQGSLRRGSAAVYMPINHPEIEEFIDIRRPIGGDQNRRCLNLHHGICIDDKFMKAVEENANYDLISPKSGLPVKQVKARELWIKLLTARIETGEPYILWTDTVNALAPVHQKELGLKIKTSNLCTEITLPTGLDNAGKQRTAVCCLSSVNLERYDEWKDDPQFILDVLYFLDNVLEDFIQYGPETHANAKYSAACERSIGLGAMGLHSLFQKNGLGWEDDAAAQLNNEIFSRLAAQCTAANERIAAERGACPDALATGRSNIRFSNVTSIAPTASISIICGGASAGVEPNVANIYTHKTLSGSFTVKNRYLKALLAEKEMDTAEVWADIGSHEGSVQHLDFLTGDQKEVFKTAFELDQMTIILMAGDRQRYIDQAQSINLFLPSDIEKKTLNALHMAAWKKNVKSLYYCRSNSVHRADKVSKKIERVTIEAKACSIDNPECEACQ